MTPSIAPPWSVSKSGSNLLARSCTRNGLGFKETEDIQAGLETLDGPASQARAHNTADQITSIAQSVPAAQGIPSFDAAGNTTQVVLSVKGQTFTTINCFDPENRLLGVSRLRNSPQGEAVTTSVVQLDYDAQGLLLRITENGTVRRLVRDRADQLARPILETDGSGNTIRWFVWANGRLLAQVQTNGAIRVAHFDELGRLLALTDGSGMLTDEFAFSPYGRVIGHSGTTTTPFTFLGSFGVWDVGHGLYLTRYRAYDANLARWLSVDPIGVNGLLARQSLPNLYVYGSDNPLAFLDVLGLWQVTIGGAYGAGGYISFGKNSGRWNISGAAGLGLGANFGWDPSDSPVYEVSEGFAASVGVEAQAELQVLHALDLSGQSAVSAEADRANNYSFGTTFKGAAQIAKTPVQYGGSLELDVRGNTEMETIRPVVEPTRPSPSLSLGGMLFSGVQGGVSWQASQHGK